MTCFERTRTATLVSSAIVMGLSSSLTQGRPPPGPPADPAIVCVTHGPQDKLIVMNADGARATTIHSTTAFLDFGPCWSPTGTSAAYVEEFSIWRIDVTIVNGTPTGSNRTLLLAKDAGVPLSWASPAWSPLGDEIVAAELHGVGLVSIPASGGAAGVIYTPATGFKADYPAWSPDGTFIAFYETGGAAGTRSIKLLERATGLTASVFGPQDYPILQLDWARTQDTLAFAMDVPQGRRVFTLSLAPGSVPQQVTTSGQSPSWSPDDSRLILEYSGGIYSLTLANGVLQKLNKSGAWPDRRRL